MTRPILLILEQRASQPRQHVPVVNEGNHWVRLLAGLVLFGRTDRLDEYVARASDPLAAESEFTDEFAHGIRRATVYSTVCPDGEWALHRWPPSCRRSQRRSSSSLVPTSGTRTP